MADNTELHSLSSEHELDIGLMRVVAAGAFTFSNRRMRIFPVILRLFMTHETELSAGCLEKRLVFALMGVMACQAITRSYRAMHIFHRVHPLMAFVTQA